CRARWHGLLAVPPRPAHALERATTAPPAPPSSRPRRSALRPPPRAHPRRHAEPSPCVAQSPARRPPPRLRTLLLLLLLKPGQGPPPGASPCAGRGHCRTGGVGRVQALFGVVDGHGGKSAAEFAEDNMPRILAEELEERLARGAGRAAVEGALRRAYLRTDEEFPSSSSNNLEQAVGGACCVTALLREGGRQLVVS
ncbi:hypothetical protein CFC21_027042, partial [Triticum aestivum]